MFDHNHYVPILKGREGEYGALKQVTDRSRDRITPLIEIPPIPWDFVNGSPSKSIDDHLKKVCKNILGAWGGERSLFLDTLWLPADVRMTDGRHPLSFLLDHGYSMGLKLIPVTGLLRGDKHVTSCRKAHTANGAGVCIRIQREDFTEFSDLPNALDALLRSVAVPIRQADLVLDLRAITDGEIDEDEVAALVRSIPSLNQWRTFTLAATSFPTNLVGLPASDCSRVQRLEWKLWKMVQRKLPSSIRKPAFGDYAISHPEPSEVDPRIMKPSASVRYTYRTYWLVMKARNLRDHGYAQFHGLCSELMKRVEYSGTGFSWGDEYIGECGRQRRGPGNLTTWRKVGTSHHLAFVLDQLSSYVSS